MTAAPVRRAQDLSATADVPSGGEKVPAATLAQRISAAAAARGK
jgi:hypothetical protein